MGEPHCAKCIGRGLKCSGNGLRVRFYDGVASRGKLKGLSKPVAAPTAQPSCKAAKKGQRRGRRLHLSASTTHDQREYFAPNIINSDDPQGYLSKPIRPCLESHESTARLLFDHYSTLIAPGMVILDSDRNRYRSIILPFATQDQLTRRAVASIAACYLYREFKWRVYYIYLGDAARPAGGRAHAWRGSLSVPCEDARQPKGPGLTKLDLEVLRFLRIQTELILVLAAPYMQNFNSNATLPPDEHLEDIIHACTGHALSCADREITSAVAQAGALALRIYRNGLKNGGDELALRELTELVAHLPPCTAGGPSLVWAYFIAAAESRTKEDRAFHTNRLREIYEITKFDNISAGLKMLEDLRRVENKDENGHRQWATIL